MAEIMTYDQTADLLRRHGLDKEHQEYSELGGTGLGSGQSVHPGYIASMCGLCGRPFIRARNQTQVLTCGYGDCSRKEGS